jgi:hypothetical protein
MALVENSIQLKAPPPESPLGRAFFSLAKQVADQLCSPVPCVFSRTASL